MLKGLPHVTIVMAACFIVGCFPGEGFFEQEVTETETVEEIQVKLVGESVQASVSKNSTVTQKVTVPEGSSIEGASLSIPPGALTVDMTVSIEETVAITSLQSGEEVEYANYAAVGVTNDAGLEKLLTPMTIQIPLSDSSTFSLTQNTEPNAVKLRISSSGGTACKEQFILEDEFEISYNGERGQNILTLEKEFFGAYQPVRISANFYTDLEIARDTVKERIAAGTATEEELLSAKNGCPIVTKTKKKELDKSSPIIIGKVQKEISNRTLNLSANITADVAMTGCTISFKNKYSSIPEPYVVSSESASFVVDLSTYLEPVSGSGLLECQFADGRSGSQEFDSVTLNAIGRAEGDQIDRTAKIFTALPEGGSCVLHGLNKITGESGSESFSSPAEHKIYFTEDEGALDLDLYVECKYPNGDVLRTDSFSLAVGACTTCSPEENPPQVISVSFPATVTTPGTFQIDLNANDDTGLDKICFGFTWANTSVPSENICQPIKEKTNGDLYAIVTVPDYVNVTPPNFWVTYVEVFDLVGNSNIIYIHDHGETTYRKATYNATTGTKSQSEVTAVPYFYFSMTAGAGHDPDIVPPLLTDIVTVPSSIIANGSYTMVFEVADAGESYDPNNRFVALCFDLKNQATGELHQHFCLDDVMHVSGDRFTGTFKISSNIEDGIYAMDSIDLRDRSFRFASAQADTNTPPTAYSGAPTITPPLLTLTGGVDNTAPVVTALSFAPGPFVVSGGTAQGVLAITALDSGTVMQFCVTIDEEAGNWPLHIGCYTPTAAGNTYQAFVTLPGYLKDGINYNYTKIEVFDQAGNVTTIEEKASADSYYHVDDLVSGFSVPTFQFSGSVSDTTPPTMTAVSISTNTVTAPSTITLTVDITETGGAGIDPEGFCATFETMSNLRDVIKCGGLTLSAGNTYMVTVDFDPWVENDTYKLTDLFAFDRAGNAHNLYAGMWSDTNFNGTGIAMPTVTVSGATLDDVSPFLTSTPATFEASSYGIGEDAYLVIHGSDATSGLDISKVCVTIADYYYVQKRVCGNGQSLGGDSYRMHFEVPSTFSAGFAYLQTIDLYDNAGNQNQYYSSASGIMYSPDPGWLPLTFNVTP